MNEIGELFRVTREEAGVTVEEASKDLDIKEVILENIEDGNIGCFKDIFVLKDNIYNYAKYLGIDPQKIVDEFNEYMFEYTSKIPVKEIERKLEEKENKQEKNEIVSPYTIKRKSKSKNVYVALYILIIFLVMVVVFWSVKQVIVNREITSTISYVK